MRQDSTTVGRTAGTLLLMLAALWAGPVLADGTETLGTPSIPLAAGTGLLQAGVGLEAGQPATIDFDVPAGATVAQVIAYWSHETIAGGDDTIDIGGVAVTGSLIGGPAFFFNFGGNPVSIFGYRADITGLGLVGPGANSLEVGGLDTIVSDPGTGAHGVGLLIVLDDGGPLTEISLVDGIDIAFCGFPEPRRSTVPQTFAVTPDDEPRDAELLLYVGSVKESETARASEIRVSFDVGGGFSLFDQITGNEGDLFDVLTVPIVVPAGAAGVTVSVQSANEAGTCEAPDFPTSVTWLAGALSVPLPEEPRCGDGIVDEGEECDDGNSDENDGCRSDCTIPVCGDGILDIGEECDDGNLDDGDGCSAECTIEAGGEGCTPGYWKQRHHFDSYVGASPYDSYDATFGVDAPGDLTLRGALRQGGGGVKAFMRHSTAAYLNSLNPDVAYGFSTAEVLARVAQAFTSGDFEPLKNDFEAQNEEGCPLN